MLKSQRRAFRWPNNLRARLYMDYYRKPINKVANDLKLKIRMAALTLEITENANKLDQTKLDINENYNDIGNIELLSDENKANISTNANKVNLLYKAHKEIKKILH